MGIYFIPNGQIGMRICPRKQMTTLDTHDGIAVLEADLTTCAFRIIVEDEVEGEKEIRL